jgi:gamma-glutamyltranspeptidase/glutathione hydrolase
MHYFLTFLILVSFSFHAMAKSQAAIAMPDKYSADVASNILQQGGHAIDATIAAAFVLAVTYPEAGNLGGGGFMTIFDRSLTKAKPENYFLDYREKAPLAASKNMYLDSQKNVIKYKSLVGYQASGVPGTVAGMWEAHQKFGRLPWKQLLQPAIKLAENGFVVPQALTDTLNWYLKWIDNKSKQPLNFKEAFGHLKKGGLFKQPNLAETLRRIATQGADEFYRGKTARYIAEQMQQNGGLITAKDLASYQVKWRNPIVADWLGYQIVSAPPPSSGGIAIVQLLKMKQTLAEPFELAKDKALKQGISKQAVEVHFYAELEKRVYADRAQYLGDPDFVKVPIEQLISEDYIEKRVDEVSFDDISSTEKVKPGLPESFETTHFSIVDFEGNAVSNTYTLNMPFGSGVVIKKAGFLMNNEMDDFSTKPKVANIFGVVGGKANEVAAEKRMLSSMSPTILLKDNQVKLVVGTPGGSSIITSVFQTIVNVTQKNMSAQQAVDAPRFHHQLLPKDVIMFHPKIPASDKADLEMMGYQLRRNDYLGDVQLIVRTKENWQAASDKRGRGVARVFSAKP